MFEDLWKGIMNPVTLRFNLLICSTVILTVWILVSFYDKIAIAVFLILITEIYAKQRWVNLKRQLSENGRNTLVWRRKLLHMSLLQYYNSSNLLLQRLNVLCLIAWIDSFGNEIESFHFSWFFPLNNLFYCLIDSCLNLMLYVNGTVPCFKYWLYTLLSISTRNAFKV